MKHLIHEKSEERASFIRLFQSGEIRGALLFPRRDLPTRIFVRRCVGNSYLQTFYKFFTPLLFSASYSAELTANNLSARHHCFVSAAGIVCNFNNFPNENRRNQQTAASVSEKLKMRDSIKFSHYGVLPGDEITVEWVRSLPNHLNYDLLVIDADYEPEDPTIRVGVLRAAWFVHEAGCVIVSRGGFEFDQRFALSEKPLVGAELLAA